MRNKNFFMIPNRIFSLGLKPKEFAVYCCLVRHSDREKNSCFPSRRLIAQECNMDKKTVCRQRENGTRTSNLYYVLKEIE